MTLMREEDFELQPYEVRRGQAREFIERALEFVENRGRKPDNGRYDLLSGAMANFQDREFWFALTKLHPVMQGTAMVAETSNLLGGPEPDRSVPLRQVWQAAQDVLKQLEQVESGQEPDVTQEAKCR